MTLYRPGMHFKFSNLEPEIFLYRELSAKNTIYLDRDGVLNEVVLRGNEISSPRYENEIKLASDIAYLANQIIVSDWNLVIVTNQPDVSREYIDRQFLKVINNLILKHVPINVMLFCPHLKESFCECRKPKTGMIDKFRQDYPQAVNEEFMIGDSLTDFECSQLAHINFIARERKYNTELVRKSKYKVSNLIQIPTILER